MSGTRGLDRRGFLARGLAAASTMLLGGCDDLSDQPWVVRILDIGRDADPRHASARSSRLGAGARI